jgi:dipeptidase E
MLASVRLYLSSFRMGESPERLLELVDDRTAVVIANAVDGAPADVRDEAVQREIHALAQLGIVAAELDLRDLSGDPEEATAALSGRGLIWVRGGDVFVLRQAMARSSADKAVQNLLERDAVAYGGYSAGVCVLAPSLQGLELVDDPEHAAMVSGAAVRWDGLGVLDYVIVPHCESPEHPETERCDRLAEHYRAAGIQHRALRDGEVIVIDERRPCSG